MKIRMLALSALVAFSIPLTVQASPLLAALKPLDIPLCETDLWRVREVYHFWQQRSERIWPGVRIEETPVIFVFPGQLDVAIGYPAPQPDWKALPGKLPILDRPAYYFPDPPNAP